MLTTVYMIGTISAELCLGLKKCKAPKPMSLAKAFTTDF